MTNKNRRVAALVVTLAAAMSSPMLCAQQPSEIEVSSVYLYRFKISPSNLGYLLTPIYNEGAGHGYSFDRTIASIYPIIGGYSPDPSAGLVPLHQWTVIQNGRAYTYYSTQYGNYGSNYHYDGSRGYVFPPGSGTVGEIRSYYSSSKGFFHGGVFVPGDLPVQNAGYNYQGVVASTPGSAGPQGVLPPGCDAALDTYCYSNGIQVRVKYFQN